jgi:hypothetical protein
VMDTGHGHSLSVPHPQRAPPVVRQARGSAMWCRYGSDLSARTQEMCFIAPVFIALRRTDGGFFYGDRSS